MNVFNYMDSNLSEICYAFQKYLYSCPCCKITTFSKNDYYQVMGMLRALQKNPLFDEFMNTLTGRTILLNIMVYEGLVKITQTISKKRTKRKK